LRRKTPWGELEAEILTDTDILYEMWRLLQLGQSVHMFPDERRGQGSGTAALIAETSSSYLDLRTGYVESGF
jgi:hypothetical protein